MLGDICTLPTGSLPVDQVKPADDIMEETEKVASSIMPEIKVDPEFKALIPPIDQGARDELERSLREQGCRDALIVCKLDGEDVLLDGHNRHEICKKLGIPFETKDISIPSRIDAKIWIIKNQRARRNLDESQRAMLAVRLEDLYAEEAKNRQGLRTDLDPNLGRGELGRSAEKAAKDMGVSHQTVSFAKKAIKKGIPELADLVKTGMVAVSAAAKAAAQPKDVQQKVVEKAKERAKEGKRPNIAAIIHEVVPRTQEDEVKTRFVKAKKNLAGCLKQLKGVRTIGHDELVELRAIYEELTACLNEIEAKTLDPSNDPTTEVKEEIKKTNSESFAPIIDEVEGVPNNDRRNIDKKPLHLLNSLADSEGWGHYIDAMKRENEDRGE